MEPSILLILCFLASLLTTTSSSSLYPYQPQSMMTATVEDPSATTHEYTRFAEVEKACKPLLSSASELHIDVHRLSSLNSELSFARGDWGQESGVSPIMPFDGSDYVRDASVDPIRPFDEMPLPDPLHLATFTLMNVDQARRTRIAVNVSGVLSLAISRNGTALDRASYFSPEFHIWPGSSELMIVFEGVYVELEASGGERVMCLLGSSKLPSRQPDSADPWEWMKGSGSSNYRPPLLQDDRILLVLRYPKTFALTSRAITGEMRSLNEKSSLKYFDKVNLSSQLGAYSSYNFGSEALVSRACRPYPYQDAVLDGHFKIYKGPKFCEVLDRFVSGEVLNVVPNWNCNSTDDYCSKLGPFESGREIKKTDGGFANVRLMMQDMRCEPRIEKKNMSSARVSAVFRVIPPWENQYMVAQRTGLNGMTLSAEGVWNSLVGQLCMLGCLHGASCHSRICLYIPTSFSIRQRNIIFGQVSSINEGSTDSHFPLSFERPIHPSELWSKLDSLSFSTYKYSKIMLAGAFLERNEPFNFATLIKKSLLSYPTLEEENDEEISLSNLANDLTLQIHALPDPFLKAHMDKPFVLMEILSIGSFLGRHWAFHNISDTEGSARPTSKTVSSERQLLLNVSGELSLSGKLYSNFSALYLEGLYNPVDGKMYLIGCRDVRASWKVLFESMDLEDGLDCLVEIEVEYPPTTARWLINPTAKISITSQRNDDDPLHFSPIKLQTLPIMYRQQREDMLSRKGVEGILRILTLSVAIACILSQLSYIRDKNSVVPYISLVMLAVQALCYSIPLITGAEALFSRIKSDYESPSYELEKNQLFQMIDYIVKIQVLGAFLLTIRLGQKVWKSRIRLLTRTPLEPQRVPKDKLVFLISLTLHAVGFLIVLIVHYINASKRPVRQNTYIDIRGNSHKLREWEVQLEEYIGLVQDFFLLPQIIGNFLWQINCRPLRKIYYVGITVVRLLPHVYDYIRAPIFNPYFSSEYEFVNPNLDFYSKFGDVAIPVTAAMLSAIILIQQKWSYHQLSRTLRSGQKSLLPLGSRVYERLPSLTFEAELVSGVNETTSQTNLQKNEV